VAKALNVDAKDLIQVEKIFADQWIGKAHAGWMIQKADGAWVKKSLAIGPAGRADSLPAFLRRAIIPDLWPEHEKNHGCLVRPDLRGAQPLLLFRRRLLPRAQSHARGDVSPLSRPRGIDLSLFLEQSFLPRVV
jgi:hypothetical protein